MAIKGLGGSKSVQSGATQSSATQTTKKFGEVLNSTKESVAAKKMDRIKSFSPQTVKGRLADLVQGGAPTRQVVAQALAENPLFKALPASVKEDLLNKVSDQMNPLLGRV